MYPSPPHHLQIRQHQPPPPPPSQRPQPSQVQSIQQSQQQQQQSQPQPKTRPSASCIPCRNRKVKVPPPSFPPCIPIHSHSNNHNNHLLIIIPPPLSLPQDTKLHNKRNQIQTDECSATAPTPAAHASPARTPKNATTQPPRQTARR